MLRLLARQVRPAKCLRGRPSIRQLSVTPCRYEDGTGNVTPPVSEPVSPAVFSDPVTISSPLVSEPVSPPVITGVSEPVTTSLAPDVAPPAPEINVELTQVFTENAPGSGLINLFKSSGDSSVVMFESVQSKWLPLLYETIQYYTDIPWIGVVLGGTLCVRLALFPVTRRTMRWPRLARELVPKMQRLHDTQNFLTEIKKFRLAQKIVNMRKTLAEKEKFMSVGFCSVVSAATMIYVNRSLRHLGYVSPLSEGGVGPFLDMSVLGDSTVGMYAFPLTIVAALGAMFHLNYRYDKWYNPRLAVIGIPAAGILVYIFGKFSLVLSMHYAVSSWFTVLLFSMQRWEKARTALDLPPVYRPAPEVPLPSLTRQIPSPTETQLIDQKDEMLIEEPVIDLRSEEELIDPVAVHPATYTPIFKIGPTPTSTTAPPSEVSTLVGDTGSDNTYVAPPESGGLMNMARKYENPEGSKLSLRFKHWRFRQRLARHGKKGVLKEFIDEAPIEQNFIRDPVQLTAEVTPGLKRYVLRRQYPTETEEQNERKISYIERTQNQRW